MFHAPIVPRVRKRSRPAEADVPRREEVKFEDVRLYLVERKMGRSRRSFLTQLAKSKGFIVEDVLSDEVTHVVSEDSHASSLWKWLKECAPKNLKNLNVLDISWFTDSMREGRPVAVETRHLIQDNLPTLPEGSTSTPVTTVSQYACQRRTTTENHNKIFTDAFEVLAESYEFSEMEGPCLAFRRAASVLKSLPWAVRCLGATQDLPCLGEHTKAVMEEVLQCGRSFEVEKILSDERYQTLKLFTSVFGVGPKTAEKWYRRGLRSFTEILADRSIHLNRMQQNGFLHYGDITRAVSKAEARSLRTIIDEAVRAITPAAILALTGGFRRGKEFGHDVDFIVTTPELGKEKSLLPNIINGLKKQQFERDLRRFARVKQQMILDNHCLYDKTKKEFLAATTEKDIFAHLGLEYIEPWQRNA
ncbi:DNA nucleotidylexotransferase isoform X3 [Perca flavescens]|uniref:DNA nucleotidylexotransferase isoform X3 n=1 Tax=Perca flavescens TaxID=8167 RepID=UPI00106DF3D5|nr:DNA nucleotidylexotransferase isoform X3 [Perca flavescens]